MRLFVFLGVWHSTFSRTPLGFTITCDASLRTPVLAFEKDGVQVLLFAVYPVGRRLEQAAQRGLDSGSGGGIGGGAGRRLLGGGAGLGEALRGGLLRLHFWGWTDGKEEENCCGLGHVKRL